MCILLLWIAVLSGMQLLPKNYASKATLIIPGASTSVNVSLDKIGQASSSPVSAYNTGTLSPKVIYKEMITSEDVRTDAANALKIPLGRMGSPRIKLVDETSLIHIELRSRDPGEARRQSAALIDALQNRLDRLRADELERRSSTVKENLAVYEQSLAQARNRIIKIQTDTGLQSATQFNEISLALVRRQQRLGELRADLDKLEREQDVLAQRIGASASTAALALRIMADPVNTKMIADLGEARSKYEAERRRLGEQHPQMIQLRRHYEAFMAELQTMARNAGLVAAVHLDMLLMLHNNTHQADLFKRLVQNESALEGRRTEVATTAREVDALDREHVRLGTVAAELEDLRKTQLVAEAVLTTAMARIATSRSDIFGSYPLIQLLTAPTMPSAPTGAQGLYAVAGGVLGTLLLALAWFLAWLRTGSVQRTLRNA